jgi:hypothetical protein
MEDLKKSIELVKSQSQKVTSESTLQMSDASKMSLVNQNIYFLNKSRSKCVAIGLSPQLSFAPVVKIFGTKNQCAIFDKNEWNIILEHQGIIENYFREGDCQWPPIEVGSKKIWFQTIQYKKIIKVQSYDSELFLGWESITELWSLLSLMNYRIEVLTHENFKGFYSSLIKGIVDMSGEFKDNIEDVLRQLKETKSDNVSNMMEVSHFMPEKIIEDLNTAKL